jgi:hypothetical protein
MWISSALLFLAHLTNPILEATTVVPNDTARNIKKSLLFKQHPKHVSFLLIRKPSYGVLIALALL